MERAEKTMTRKITVLTLCAILLTLCVPAGRSSRPARFPELGFCRVNSIRLIPARLGSLDLKASAKVCGSWATLRIKPSLSSTGTLRHGRSGCQRWPRNSSVLRLRSSLRIQPSLPVLPGKLLRRFRSSSCPVVIRLKSCLPPVWLDPAAMLRV